MTPVPARVTQVVPAGKKPAPETDFVHHSAGTVTVRENSSGREHVFSNSGMNGVEHRLRLPGQCGYITRHSGLFWFSDLLPENAWHGENPVDIGGPV